MNFRRVDPQGPARQAVECYWTVDDDDTTGVKQKIIPDGFTEIIFHFGDHYRINLKDRWTKQSKSLFASQIKGHFFLENSGRTEILGIKLKPSAVAHLFDVSMKGTVDTVVDLKKAIGSKMKGVESLLRKETDNNVRIEIADRFFDEACVDFPKDHPVDKALDMIFGKKGMTAVGDVCSELGITERYLEQLFQKYVGLSPKFLARIVRFSYIFQVIKDQDPDWAAVVYEAGYYDQSHFIRNFKQFTGEDPSAYIFAERSLANFFMRKMP